MTTLTLTDVGRAALANDTHTGTNAITITRIVASRRINSNRTSVFSVIAGTDFIGGSGGTPGSIAGHGLFEGAAAWTAPVVSVLARIGGGHEFILAYAQDSAGVLTKPANVAARYAVAFVFVNSAADVTVSVPATVNIPVTAASEQTPGIIAFASAAEVAARSPVDKAVRPADVPAATRFASDAEATARAAVDAAIKPNQLPIWRSNNFRAPRASDTAYPVGHLWRWGGNEWMLDTVAAGTAEWRQVRGIERIYYVTSRPFAQSQYSLTLSRAMGFYSFLEFHTRHTNPALSRQDLNSPVQISFLAFSSGSSINITDANNRTTNFTYGDIRTINVRTTDTQYYISQIYGVY